MFKKFAVLLLGVVGIFALSGAGHVTAAGEPQLCKTNSSCIVGEFLYDDNYSPINVGATCTFLSRDPNGNVFVNSQAMSPSGQNDGWYSYALNIGQTVGIYPSSVCCTVPADIGTTQYLCLDKSFKVGPEPLTATETANAVWDAPAVGHTSPGSLGNNLQNPTLTLSDIWGYSSRTLSLGSSLVQEIWNYTETSTNNFAALISKIWSHGTVANLATKTDIAGVGSSLADIGNKIDSLDTKVSSIGTTVGNILSKWGSYSATDIISNVTTVQSRIGTTADTCATNSVFGNIDCVKQKWGSQTAQSLYDTALASLNIGTTLKSELTYNGKTTKAYEDLQSIVSYVDSLETANTNIQTNIASIGTSLVSINNKIDSLDTKVSSIGTSVGVIISKWGSYSVVDVLNSIGNVTSGIGSSTDTCATNSIFGNIACVKDKWGSQTAQSLFDVALNALNIGTSIKSELTYNGKTTKAYEDLQTISNYVDTLETASSNIRSDIASVKTVVDSIETKVNSLDTKVSTINTNVSSVLTKWGSYSVSDILSSISTINSNLGTGSDSCLTNTVFGNIDCVKQKWGSQTAQSLYDIANNAYGVSTSIKSELTYNGKTTKAYEDFQTIYNYVDSLETSIGNSSDPSSANTLFAKVKGNKEDIAGVQTTVDSISTKIDLLSSNLSVANSKVDTLVAKWSTYSITDVISSLTSVRSSIGVSSDTCGSTTVIGGINCIQNSSVGGTDSALLAAVNNTNSLVTQLSDEVNYHGKSTTAYSDLQTLKTNISNMISAVGTSADTALADTVFGRIKKVQNTVEALDVSGAQATTIIDKWGSLSASDIYDKVKDLSSQISNINTVSNVSSILSISQKSSTDLQVLKNHVLAMKALVNVNKTLLEKTTVKPIIKTWLEEGSIIFKTMITNPGTTTQTVPLKFYLPKEADKKNIIKIDSGLDVTYDSNESAFYVSGEFTLKPNETKIVAIEVEDVWKIAESQLTSLKTQATELSSPLKNTAYFAQGVTLKSDINAQLETIARTQKEAVTPDSRIKAYRDNLAQLSRVQSEIGDLKGLVTSVSSNSSLMGFVGGSQAISSWAVVVILIVGLVFLTIYMRTAINQLKLKKTGVEKNNHHHHRHLLSLSTFIVAVSFSSFSGTWALMDKFATPKNQSKPVPIVAEVSLTTPTPVILGAKAERIELSPVSTSSPIKVRNLPDISSLIIAKIWKSTHADKYSENGDWVEIGADIVTGGKNQYVRGWVKRVYQ